MAKVRCVFPTNKQAVLSIKLKNGSEKISKIKSRLDSIKTEGKHVFFDVADIATTPQLYLCSIFIDVDNDLLRIYDQFTGKHYIGGYVPDETLSEVLSRAVDSYVRINVTATTGDGVAVTGQTVYVHNGTDESAPVVATAQYSGKPVSILVNRGIQYFVRISDTLSGHFNPTTASGFANSDVNVTLTYSDVNSVKRLEDIAPALMAIGNVTTARELLVGKRFDDVWIDYDSPGKKGDAKTYSDLPTLDGGTVTEEYPSNSQDNYPVWYDPLIIIDVNEVEDENGNKHIGAKLIRKYASVKDIVFDAPNQEVATEETAQEGVYYYGLATGQTSATPANLTILSLNVGDEIPYGSYSKVFKNAYNDSSKNILQYGHNRYETSAYRQYLMSSAEKNQWWEQKHIGQVAPSSASSYCGYKKGCSSRLLSLIKKTKISIYANTVTDKDGEYFVYDDIFLPCCNDMYGIGNNVAEAEYPFTYWKGLVPDAMPFDNKAELNAQRKMIRVSNKSSSSGSYVRLRSATRTNSYNVWYVNTTGSLNGGNASNACAASPACVIY